MQLRRIGIGFGLCLTLFVGCERGGPVVSPLVSGPSSVTATSPAAPEASAGEIRGSSGSTVVRADPAPASVPA
ncbi:MAG: hypothetical protein KC486_06470, partial [Myxococcales bacterium]|nr:hypothetical protein [Myxococcales bacterium]